MAAALYLPGVEPTIVATIEGWRAAGVTPFAAMEALETGPLGYQPQACRQPTWNEVADLCSRAWAGLIEAESPGRPGATNQQKGVEPTPKTGKENNHGFYQGA